MAAPPLAAATHRLATAMLTRFDRLADASVADAPVWYDDEREEWRSSFPPPARFDGDEDCEPGGDLYERALTTVEAAIVGRIRAAAVERTLESDARQRDDWFHGAGGGGV